MPWTAPIVGYSDNVGRLRCSQCASAEQRQHAVSGDQWPGADDLCENCGRKFPHIKSANYVQVADGYPTPDYAWPVPPPPVVLVEPFGPDYPALAGCAKHRRAAAKAGSVAAMDKAERQAYGAAVEAGILALQRAAFTRAYAPPSANCASGTFHNDAAAIERAVIGRQRSELARAARQDREGRSDDVVRELYEAAMVAKRRANSPVLEAAE